MGPLKVPTLATTMGDRFAAAMPGDAPLSTGGGAAWPGTEPPSDDREVVTADVGDLLTPSGVFRTGPREATAGRGSCGRAPCCARSAPGVRSVGAPVRPSGEDCDPVEISAAAGPGAGCCSGSARVPH